ncbi:hypothetical protein DRO35_02005 [Candidatus Bathyarchaeota archaeon]|nr:MAG: hypothetical protein DRO35_02005 [Candidatus Bathyarchaeota archaeon]
MREAGVKREIPPAIQPIFPSYRRRYMHAPPEYAYKCIIHMLKENMSCSEIKRIGELSLRTRLSGYFGAVLSVQISREGEISILDLRFNYIRVILFAALLLGATIVLSLLSRSVLPMLGAAAFLPIAYKVNGDAVKSLMVLNETLSFAEKAYVRQGLLKERERLRRSKVNAAVLYEKLRRKHIKTWGDTNVLKYKIEEYQSAGFTYEEAIIKIAEEEGVTV